MELAGGERHAQLNASMVPWFAVFVCLFIVTYMANPVETSLDDASVGQSYEQFWTNLFREADFLCSPTRDCADSSHHSPAQISLSSAGPKSCNQLRTNKVLSGSVGRAEGCGVLPRPPREFTFVDETMRPTSSKSNVKRSWRRAVQRAIVFGKVKYHGRWIRLKQILQS